MNDGKYYNGSSLRQDFALLSLSIMLFVTYPQSPINTLGIKIASVLSTIGILFTTWGYFINGNDELSLLFTSLAEILSLVGIFKIALSNPGDYKGYSDWYLFSIDSIMLDVTMLALAFISTI